MTRPSYRIAVTGTHSTGKTSFVERLKGEFEARGLKADHVHDSAANARALGFPILADHTFESTAWLMARAMQLETEATLSADVILIDRPVPDALGYLLAALAHSGRALDPIRLGVLEKICAAWASEYDLVFRTVLDPSVPIGQGRDGDETFRIKAGEEVAAVVDRLLPARHLLRNGDSDAALALALAGFDTWNGTRSYGR